MRLLRSGWACYRLVAFKKRAHAQLDPLSKCDPVGRPKTPIGIRPHPIGTEAAWADHSCVYKISERWPLFRQTEGSRRMLAHRPE